VRARIFIRPIAWKRIFYCVFKESYETGAQKSTQAGDEKITSLFI